MIRLLVLLIICLFLVTLNLSNSYTLVSLNYFFGVTTRPIRVASLVSGVFAAGMVLGWLFGLPAWIRLKLELRRMKKAQDQLEADLHQQQKTEMAERLKVPAVPDTDEF